MKKLILLLIVVFLAAEGFTQTVGISDATFTPNSQAVLDLSSDRRGFLPPRLELNGNDLPISGTKPAGLMVYNSGGAIGPDGLYYWTGSAWTQVATGSNVVYGSGTLNYISKWTPDGTTIGNSQLFDDGTNVGVGTSTTSSKLSVAGTTTIYNENGGLLVDTDGDAELHVGEQVDAAGTVGEAYRLALQPYGHTGGPFNFVARDDVSSAFLDLRYGAVTAASSLFSLQHNGNIGMGTSNPAYKLDVRAGSDQVYIESTSDAPLYLKGTDTWSGIGFSDASNTSYIWYNGGNQTFAIGGGGANVSGKKLHIDGGTTIGSSYDGQAVPANGLLVEGNTGLGTTSASQRLQVNGNIKLDDNMMVEGTSTWRVYRNLASFNSGSNAAPGAFIINTTQPWNSSCMFRVKVEGFFYDSSSPFECTMGGYIYNNNTFYNIGYVNVGGKDLQVRYARNTSTNTLAIILGSEGSTYPYPKLNVTSFMQGHSSINEAYADGWIITQLTSLSGYDYVTTVPNVTTLPTGSGSYVQNQISSSQSANFWVSGNAGVGGTSPAAKFHVSGGGQIIGTNGSSSNSRTLTVLSDGQAQINHGSYPGAWTSALQIQNNDNSDYVWLSPLDDASNARLLTHGSGLDFYVGSNAHGMTLTSNGNLGIGSTAPAQKLQVNGNADLAGLSNYLSYNNRTDLGLFGDGNYSLSLNAPEGISINIDANGNGTSTPFSIRENATGPTGGNALMTVLENGNVGIGLAGPQRLLDVNGPSRMRDWLSFGSSDNVGRITWGGGNRFYMNGFSGYMLSLGSNGSVDQMLIDLNGNVGIGSTSLSTKLQLAHTSSGGMTGLSGYGGVHLDQNAGNDGYVGITTSATSSGTQGGILFQGSGSYGTKIHFFTTPSYASGMQNRMTIDHYGNVAIGTTSPTEKLHVDGAIVSQNGKVKRDFLTWNTTSNTNVPIHIKTNITFTAIMYRFLVEGYNYGMSRAINSEAVGYAYTNGSLINMQNVNHSNGVSISQYKSSDGYVVIRLDPGGSNYYLGFSVSGWFVNPTGTNFNISATVYHQSSNL